MVTIAPKEKGWSDVGEAFGSGFVSSYQNRSDELALQNAISSLPPNASAQDIIKAVTGTRTHNPDSKKNMLTNYFEANKQEETARHNKATEEKDAKSSVDKELLKSQLIANGYPDYEADLFVNSPPSVQNRMAAQHQDLISRRIRHPLVQQNPQAQPLQNQPQETVNPEQPVQNQPEQMPVQENIPQEQVQPTEIVEEVVPLDKKGYPFPDIPPETTLKEKEAWRNKNQAFNNKELKEFQTKTNENKKIGIQLNTMRQDNDSGEIPEGLSRLIIDPKTGEPYPLAQLGGLVNKQTQRFVKTINDFVSGAKAFFGGRVSNFEVDTFKSRLPNLMNTSEGRRLIIEQMSLMNELESIHNNEMEKALQHYGRNADYSFISKVVDERTSKNSEEIINKLNSLVDASDYLDQMYDKPEKYKNSQLIQDPKTGKFNAIDKSKISEAKKRGYIIW